MEQLQLSLELDTVTDKMAVLAAGLKRDRMGAIDRQEFLEQQINKQREKNNEHYTARQNVGRADRQGDC